ncbi:hypothetical protein FS749_011288 [Ceratobasidium sp. UAMH 11750]|nr:hypothetical protein FS749_011288 [Ceratobasidium sp. UAMH 11750]
MTNQPGPSHPIPSYYPQNQPLANYPPYNATSQIPSKTPSRKVMQANVVGFITKHHKYRSRGLRKRVQASAGSHRSPSEGLNGPTTELQPVNNSVPGATYDDAKPILRKAVFYQLVAVELWPIRLGSLRQAALDFLCSTPGGPALVELTEQDPKFDRLLRDIMSNVRGDLFTYTRSLIKYAYDVTPKSKARLDTLLEDKNFNFLYEKEMKVSSKQAGFCCHEAVSRVICALLFDTPSKIGLLYMDQLCLADKPEDWYKKLKDRSPDAKRGVPIGLIAFAGVLIMHILECVQDENPGTSRKAHKFEGTRYRKQWTRIRD